MSECSNVRESVCVCASGRARTRTRAGVYNDTAKAAPHVSHYDFSALLLIKMQIYRGGGASERERSGGKTDYVWGRHDKHRNMINSTQPHPGTPTPPPSPRPPVVPLLFPTPPHPALISVLPRRHPLTRRISFFPPSNFPVPTFRHPTWPLRPVSTDETRTAFISVYSSLFPIDIETAVCCRANTANRQRRSVETVSGVLTH